MFLVLAGKLISSDVLLGSEGTFTSEDGRTAFPAQVDALVVCAECGDTHLEVSRTG